MKYLIPILAVISIACTDQDMASDQSSFATALAASPVGEVCVFGEIEEIFVPSNRGKNGKGELREVDNRTYEPAFYRMDMNNDGLFNRDDAQLATKRIYMKQIDSKPCPAQADIAPVAGIPCNRGSKHSTRRSLTRRNTNCSSRSWSRLPK